MDNNLSSTYPFPPSYFTYFTDESIKKLKEFQEQNEGQEPSFPLNILIPPTKPEGKAYRSFGNQWQFDNTIMSLKDVGIPQLYKLGEDLDEKPKTEEAGSEIKGEDTNENKVNDIKTRSQELKKLVHSLLIKFVELCGVMSISPEQFPAVVEEIRIILINTHHLMNEYRPHQSRESLLSLLQQQVDKTKDEVKDLKQKNNDIRQKIAGLTKRFKQIGNNDDLTRVGSNDSSPIKNEEQEQYDGNGILEDDDSSEKLSVPPSSTLTLTAKALDQISWGLLEFHERQSSV